MTAQKPLPATQLKPGASNADVIKDINAVVEWGQEGWRRLKMVDLHQAPCR